METIRQISAVSKILDILSDFSRDEILKIILECNDYIVERKDLFPEEEK
jgi:hypothetical protein